MARRVFDLDEIRRTAITAVFSDSVLAELVVLKGGNALGLVYRVSTRTSIDLDFSISGDFENPDDAKVRLFAALRDRFDARGYVVIDLRFQKRPQLRGTDEKPWWGGYELSFKLVERDVYTELLRHPGHDKVRIHSIPVGARESRSFKIDFSKYEYTGAKIVRELEDYTVYVYSPAMIVVEKLRAICQQMDGYPHRGARRARARDFYDIHQVLTNFGFDLAADENLTLAREIFAAKRVPLRFLGTLPDVREFHRPDWVAVVETTTGALENFDFYFDFVVAAAGKLKALWVEEPPLG